SDFFMFNLPLKFHEHFLKLFEEAFLGNAITHLLFALGELAIRVVQEDEVVGARIGHDDLARGKVVAVHERHELLLRTPFVYLRAPDSPCFFHRLLLSKSKPGPIPSFFIF
ncbi:MAG: hypothetical protein Q8M94_07750, partial [Ignavibacteria bacterium]|nr:hypothetical protein [Ignavibacteria bacterium]